jgi:hypothetical protein
MTYPPPPGSGYPGDQGVPGQPPQSGYGVQQPYGSPPPPYGQSPYGQPAFGQPAYGQSSYGQPPPAGSSGKTNGLAIASLITGLSGCMSVIGLILGFIALGQIKQRGDRGRGMAIAGIILFGVWSVVSVLIVVLAPDTKTSGNGGPGVALPKPSNSRPAISGPKKLDVWDMRVGDCINDATETTLDPSSNETVRVKSVERVSCNQPHDAEVMAKFKVPGVVRPSEEDMRRTASTGCRARVTPKLAGKSGADELNFSYYFPTVTSWALGNRTVTCAVVSATNGKKLTHPIG